MSVRNEPFAYFWMYWSTDCLYDLLAFMTLREVFRRVFPTAVPTFRRLRWLLPTTAVLLMSASLYGTFYGAIAGVHPPWFVRAIYWFNLGVHGIEGIFLLLVLGLVLIFAVPWPRYEMAILSGFGVCAYTTMLSLLLRFQGGSRYDLLFRYGPPFGFIAATLIWLFAFIRPAISYTPEAFLVTGSPARATDPNGSTHSGQSKRHF